MSPDRGGCSKFEIQAFRVENSLFIEKFSLIRVRKFPVPLRREFTSKLLNSLADGAPKSQRMAGFREIPCSFTVPRFARHSPRCAGTRSNLLERSRVRRS
jgi:hypothetical protein